MEIKKARISPSLFCDVISLYFSLVSSGRLNCHAKYCKSSIKFLTRIVREGLTLMTDEHKDYLGMQRVMNHCVIRRKNTSM